MAAGLRPGVGVNRWSAIAAALWSAAVGYALTWTLDSLSEPGGFDGLMNNMLQIPLALPWFLLPISGIWSHEVDAWIVAGMGWLNALLILLFGPWLIERAR
jgi:ABC-type sulfate transport system permease component